METDINTPTVLIVDDSPDCTGIAHATLQKVGYRVVMASSGEEGVRSAALIVPDLILLHLLTPGSDSLEVCRRIKAQESTRNTPVIFVSAAMEPLDKVNVFGLGAVDYLITPMVPEELFARVQTHLKIRQLEGKLRAASQTLEERVAARTAELSAEIEERKRTAEALQQSEQKFRAMFDQAFQFIKVLSVEGHLLQVNQTALQFAGVDGAEVLGRPIWETPWWAHSRENQEQLRAAVQEAAGGKLVHFETTHAVAGGQLRQMDFTLKPIFDAAGKVVQLIAEGRDITERKRMDDALVFVAQRGWQSGSENFLNGLARFLCEKLEMEYAFIDTTDENRETAQTVAVCARGAIAPNLRYTLKGTPCENVMGRNLCVYRRAIQQLFPDDVLLSQMGAESYVGIPLWDSVGKPIGLIAVLGSRPIADDAPVTQLLQLVATRAAAELERARAEEALVRLNAELEQRVRQRTAQLESANRDLEAFSYSVSHDLRVPLRSIDGFSKILLEDYGDKLDAEGKDTLARIHAAIHRMGQLIEDILKLSRHSGGEMHIGRVDLSALVRNVAEELEKTQPDRHVELVIAPDLVAEADAGLMRVVLENLLGNAWKFTNKEARPRIEFGGTSRDGVATFFVRDNGTGFDMAYAHKLFGAFQRLHSPSEYPGTGVGLASVQRIIQRHGGRVWAEGEVNRGATFYFSLSSPK